MRREEWKDVLGYEGFYQVSNLGRVKSLARIDARGSRRKERIMKTPTNSAGYCIVSLSKNSKRKIFRVHRLVYEAFEGPIPHGYEIHHKDGTKDRNALDNLVCLTPKQHAKRDRCGDDYSCSKLTTAEVQQIRKLAKMKNDCGNKKYSYRQIGEKFNIHPATVGQIVRYERWKYV